MLTEEGSMQVRAPRMGLALTLAFVVLCVSARPAHAQCPWSITWGANSASPPVVFGPQLTGTPGNSQTVTITIPRSSLLNYTIQSVAVSGPASQDFAASFNPTTTPLFPGESATVSVSFKPTDSGVRNASLDIAYTSASPIGAITGLFAVMTCSIPLQGTGASSDISASPNPLVFGPQAVDTT